MARAALQAPLLVAAMLLSAPQKAKQAEAPKLPVAWLPLVWRLASPSFVS
jgi:hypothetical protein